jgi:diguanylate cyclase (GGDEF)-like protein
MDPVRILLLTDDQAQQRRWQEALAQSAVHFLGSEDLTSDHVDLVLTDSANSNDELLARSPQSARDEIGVISVGTSDGADVQLPTDCSDREIRLSSELLAHVIQLRRERNTMQQRERELVRMAYSDPLTELPNRRAWDRDVPIQFQSARHNHQPLCLAVLDLDNFKQLNDRLGHQAGDEVLRDAGRKLSEHTLPGQDYIARLGGDEFGYVICGLQFDKAVARVEKARVSLSYQSNDPSADYGTASAGMSCFHNSSSTTWETLLAAADCALRQAKAGGRDQLVQASVE